MILVVFLVAAWLVILGPGMLKRRGERRLGGRDSITHFHQQLRVLEHAGPTPIVPPAYRLHAVDGAAGPTESALPTVTSRPVLTVVGVDPLPRPALAFLGEDPEQAAPSTASAAGSAAPGTSPAAGSPLPQPANPPIGLTPKQLARRRRRDTLTVLVLLVVSTLLIGIIPGARLSLVLSVAFTVILASYVALLVRMRAIAMEHADKLRYLRDEPRWDGVGATGADPGYPHADEHLEEQPRQRAYAR